MPKSYWMGLKDIIDLQLSQESIWFMHSSIKEYYSAYLGSWTLKVSRATGRRTGGWSRLWRQGAGGKSGWGGSRQIRVSVPPTLAASKSYNLSPSQPKKAYFPFFGFGRSCPLKKLCNQKQACPMLSFPRWSWRWKAFGRLGVKGCTTVVAGVGMLGVERNHVFGSWRRKRDSSCMSSIMRWVF